jgi:glycosyltransferase involved in cell wall biosynthesis
VETSASQTTIRFSKFSIPEVVEHGVDGFLLQPGDLKEAARDVIELLSRADRGREMGKTAHINAKKKFCANDVIPAYENYYKRILAERK